MPRPTVVLVVSADQRKQIGQWVAALGTPQQVALRGRIVLAAGDGKSEAAIAADLKVDRKTVRLWRERFVAKGLPGLWEIAPGRGRKATYSAERIKAVIDATLQSKTKRDHDAFRRTGCAARQSHRRLSPATPSSGILEVSSAHRPGVSGPRAAPSGGRQLRHARHRRGQGLAPQAFSLCHALCAHQLQ